MTRIPRDHEAQPGLDGTRCARCHGPINRRFNSTRAYAALPGRRQPSQLEQGPYLEDPANWDWVHRSASDRMA